MNKCAPVKYQLLVLPDGTCAERGTGMYGLRKKLKTPVYQHYSKVVFRT